MGVSTQEGHKLNMDGSWNITPYSPPKARNAPPINGSQGLPRISGYFGTLLVPIFARLNFHDFCDFKKIVKIKVCEKK